MISVIVCHRHKFLLERFIQNVSDTIGVPHECIVIDNSDNKYNIFQAYNEGVKKSIYPIVSFIHEDVFFRTKCWGVKLISHLEDKSVGLVGIAGGTSFPSCPSSWANDQLLNTMYANLMQHESFSELKTAENYQASGTHLFKNPSGKNVNDTATLDGVFISARKELFEEKVRFDCDTFDGFHCYDSDICFQVLTANYRVVVVFDILVDHFSTGNINKSWIVSAERLVAKWEKKLPLFIEAVDENLVSLYCYKTLLSLGYRLQNVKGYDDNFIKNIIRKYYPKIKSSVTYKESLFLWLWMKLGFNNARYAFKIVKYFGK